MGKRIEIWTDGSAVNNDCPKKGFGGYGAVMLFTEPPKDKKELYTEYADTSKALKVSGGYTGTTNQQMEIKAVTEALKKIKNNKHKIAIYSDSAYVINCFKQKWYKGWITNGWKNSKKQPVANKEFWEELLEVINDNWYEIEWIKVKGHDGAFYNELADDLATEQTEKIYNESTKAK